MSASLDAIGLRACLALHDRGVRVTARLGLAHEASEVTVTDDEGVWTCGAGDLATAASAAAHRLGHHDLVTQIAAERRALQTADTIPPAAQETV